MNAWSTYEVWFRREPDSRAPSFVSLRDEYRKQGTVEAAGLRHVERLFFASLAEEVPMVGATRAIRIGDIVIDKRTNIPYIYTATGSWAIVTLQHRPIPPLTKNQ